MAVHEGGAFDCAGELRERLRQGPSASVEEASPEGVPPPSRWTLEGVRECVPALEGYSLSGVWRFLRGQGMKPRSAAAQRYSPDPAYLEKQAALEARLREAAANPGEVPALFLDEMGHRRWPEAARDWMAAAPEPVRQAERAGPDDQQWRVAGALNAQSGRVDYLDAYMVGRLQLVSFHGRIEAACPEARKIYVAQGNWPIHHHDEVLAAIEAREAVIPLWLPTCSPWLNPIEKLWRWLREEVLKLRRMAEAWPELRARARGFLDRFAHGSRELLRYVGLLGEGRLARALRVA